MAEAISFRSLVGKVIKENIKEDSEAADKEHEETNGKQNDDEVKEPIDNGEEIDPDKKDIAHSAVSVSIPFQKHIFI